MKILYGVVGEGMGHAIRSRVIIEELLKRGHDVSIMASSRACDFLTKRFGQEEVHRIHGFHMIYEDNRVRIGKTLWSNIEQGLAGIPTNIEAYFHLISEFKPEAVISDFESWTYLYGRTHRLPTISIDNMQIINRCTLPDEILNGAKADFEIAKSFVKGKLPSCSYYLITTFFSPPVRKENTELFPPILRPEILNAKSSKGNHILVYQTGEGYERLTETLSKTDFEYRIYGMRRNITEVEVEGNLHYCPFSESQFIEDLSSAAGVIAGGGFTLMGEAVYLHKPMLSVPLQGQFEQILNARYLELVGYGKAARDLNDPSTVAEFLRELPQYESNLASYKQDGNNGLLGRLDELLDRAAVGLL
jgi:uncharacterized protein (TIGR00661 family)